MRKTVLATAFVALTGGTIVIVQPAAADLWAYRSGLWEETFESASSGTPASEPRNFCIPSDVESLVMFPDPDLYESETCKEKLVSQTATDRLVEEICDEPALRDRPVRPVWERHHLTKNGKGMSVDWREIRTGVPRVMQTRRQRWVSDDCGDVSSR
jgi:hypothetical protein